MLISRAGTPCKRNAAPESGVPNKACFEESALGELGSTTGGLQTVLHETEV